MWALLGDVHHYIEPFAGSLAVLLNRPHESNRPYHSETVNDLDGLLVNAWRAIQAHPDAVAAHASSPVMEADVHARHAALVRWRESDELARLMGSPERCDPKMAGWWLYGICAWIGSGWCSGRGPWTVDDAGRLVKGGRGVWRQLPHLGDNGMGVHRPQLREPGVSRKRPHLGDDGKGDYHPVTMPELARWMRYLSARLRHVRIINGDWRRVCTSGAAKTLPVRQGKGPAGVFLDPPYADTATRTADLYAADSATVAHDVRRWCVEHGADPDYRIVLAGYEGEHGGELERAGWRAVEWFKSGFLTGGMGNTGGSHQQGRERLWASPHCLRPAARRQVSIFGGR